MLTKKQLETEHHGIALKPPLLNVCVFLLLLVLPFMVSAQSNPAYNAVSSSSSPTVSATTGNQIYVCAIGSDGDAINSESWTQTTNTLYTSIGLQNGNTCTANLASSGSSIIGAFGVNVPVTTNVVEYDSGELSNPGFQYTVQNSISTVVIAISKYDNDINSVTLPSGCTEELLANDIYGDGVYYAVCTNQAPGVYSVSSQFRSWNGAASAAVYVFEHPTPSNPQYNATSYTTTPATSAPAVWLENKVQLWACQGQSLQ